MGKAPEAFRTISEVAELLQTPAHVLRFWESKFPQVRPVKRAGGRRYYRPADLTLLAGIRTLLHDQGMTIRGVQKMLQENGVKHVAALGEGLVLLGDDAVTVDGEITQITDNAAIKPAGLLDSDSPSNDDTTNIPYAEAENQTEEFGTETEVEVATGVEIKAGAYETPQQLNDIPPVLVTRSTEELLLQLAELEASVTQVESDTAERGEQTQPVVVEAAQGVIDLDAEESTRKDAMAALSNTVAPKIQAPASPSQETMRAATLTTNDDMVPADAAAETTDARDNAAVELATISPFEQATDAVVDAVDTAQEPGQITADDMTFSNDPVDAGLQSLAAEPAIATSVTAAAPGSELVADHSAPPVGGADATLAAAPQTPSASSKDLGPRLAARLRSAERGSLGKHTPEMSRLATRLDVLLDRMSVSSGAGRW
jgi:DNA-binding transcriptional MerR regulator